MPAVRISRRLGRVEGEIRTLKQEIDRMEGKLRASMLYEEQLLRSP